MKKICIIAIAACLLLSGCSNKYSQEVVVAMDALKTEWSALYSEYEAIWDEDVENVMSVNGTKVWIIRNTKVEEFRKIDYLVEFDIENNIDCRGYNTVAIYNDGRVEVMGTSPFVLYTSRTGSEDFSAVLDGEADLKKKYNRTIELD